MTTQNASSLYFFLSDFIDDFTHIETAFKIDIQTKRRQHSIPRLLGDPKSAPNPEFARCLPTQNGDQILR